MASVHLASVLLASIHLASIPLEPGKGVVQGVVNFEVFASSHSIKMLRKELQQSSISQIDFIPDFILASGGV